MNGSEQLWSQLHSTFDAELRERVDVLGHDLLALEEADGAAVAAQAFAALYRVAYNLQGAANVVELPDVAHLAGTLAAAFLQARAPEVQLSGTWFAAISRAIDFLSPLVEAGRAGSQPDGFFDVLADLVAPAVIESAPIPTLAVPPAADPAPAAPVAALPSASGAPAESVRVKVGKLDALFAGTGELAVARIRIGQRLTELNGLREEFTAWRRESRQAQRQRAALRRHLISLPEAAALLREFDHRVRSTEVTESNLNLVGERIASIAARLRSDMAQLSAVAETLADEVLAVRLLPVATAFGPFERLVRDLARDQGKAIELALVGGATEIDRKVLERLRDPLIHMLRNAIDHGIEAPEVRQLTGKPPTGQIRLTVANRGGAVEITLADDGGGLDPVRLRAAAVRKGLFTEERAAALDEEAAFGLIFHPGFSTTAVPTTTSGRGVGMDVVRDEVTRLGGQLQIASVLGRGTTFTITVPLTLATTRAILVEVAGQRLALPSMPIERTARLRNDELVALEGRRTVTIEGRPVPIVALAEVLGLPSPAAADPRAWQPYVVLRQDERQIAVLVERLIGEQELVVKPLGWPLRRVRHVGGVAVLGSGETVAILNPTDVLRGGLQLVGVGAGVDTPATSLTRTVAAPARRRRVLVVDDSLTTRTLERGILEAAGYDALVASDGAEALGVLGREGIDLVVSDVEMPRLDGFGLTAAIRRDERLRHIPVILVTSLDTAEHRERGVMVGADAYLGKGTFDQGQLLDTIGRLL